MATQLMSDHPPLSSSEPIQPPDAAPEPETTALVRRRAGTTVLMFIIFIIALFVFEQSPANGIPLCPFRFLTGFSCPGCGMTRSCTAAVHGDLLSSLGYHPLGAAFVLSFGAVAARRAVELWRGQRVTLPSKLQHLIKLTLISALVFSGLFGIARLILELAGILTPV